MAQFGANINEVNINLQGAKEFSNQAKNTTIGDFVNWGKVANEAAGVAVQLSAQQQAAQAQIEKKKQLVARQDGINSANADIMEASGMSPLDRRDYYDKQIKDKTPLLAQDGGYSQGYIARLSTNLNKTMADAEKQVNKSTANTIRTNMSADPVTLLHTDPSTIVDNLSSGFTNVPKSVIRDSVYAGASDYLKLEYEFNVDTEEELLELDKESTILKAKFNNPQYRASNSQVTKAMIANSDSEVKAARDAAITRIQLPFKQEKAILDSSVSSASNIDTSVEGTITIMPTYMLSNKEYMSVSMKSGQSKANAIKDVEAYAIKRDRNIKVREEVAEYKEYDTPFKDLPLEPEAKKILTAGTKLQARQSLRIGDYSGATRILQATQTKLSLGPDVSSLLYSEDPEQQEMGLAYYSSLAHSPEANTLIPMVLTPEEVSEFTAVTSLRLAGYSPLQTKMAIENYRATPASSRRMPSKDVQEKLSSKGEDMTSKQYSTVKNMVNVMSNNGVSEDVIEDYIDDMDDKFVTKVDTTLTFGGFNVLNEGGIVPSVSEPLLVESYNEVISKTLANNPSLEKGDVTIVYQGSSSDVVVVLKQDPSIVLSKGLTNMQTLTKAVAVHKATTKPDDGIGIGKTAKKFAKKIGNSLIEEGENSKKIREHMKVLDK